MIPWKLYAEAAALLLVLGAIIYAAKRFGIGQQRTHEEPTWDFSRKTALLSPTEAHFLKSLTSAVPAPLAIAVQVHLGGLLNLPRTPNRSAWQHHKNAIDRRLDFVVHDEAFRIVGVVELDDPSHDNPTQKAKDNKLDAVLASAGIPIMRIRPQRSYAELDLYAQVRTAFSLTGPSQTPAGKAPSPSGRPGSPPTS